MFCFDGDEHGMLTESEHLSLLSDGNDYPSCQLSVHRPQTCCEGKSTREHTCLVLLEKMDWFIFFLHVAVNTPVLNSNKEARDTAYWPERSQHQGLLAVGTYWKPKACAPSEVCTSERVVEKNQQNCFGVHPARESSPLASSSPPIQPKILHCTRTSSSEGKLLRHPVAPKCEPTTR